MVHRVEGRLLSRRRVAVLVDRRDGGGVRFEEAGDVSVEVARLAHAASHEFGLVGWERGEGEGAFGVLGLFEVVV